MTMAATAGSSQWHDRSDSAPDAIVIGAGHNGLVAANMLAERGWTVLLCEATGEVGGAVRSAEVTAPGYLSDLFSAFYPLAAVSPALRSLRLGDYGLTWTHAPQVLAHVFPDDRCALLSRDLDTTADSVEQFGAGDGAAWRSLAGQWADIAEPLIDALFSPLPALVPVQRLVRKLGIGGGLRFARMLSQPVRRLGDELFAGDGARILLAGNALHADLAPESAGGAIYGWLLAMLGQTEGFPVPVGGAGQLSEALRVRLVAHGGTIRLNSPVDTVLVQGNRAVGVRLAGGEEIRARRAVLADVPAPTLFSGLVPQSQLPARFIADLANFEWDLPTLKLNWALSEPIGWTARAAVGAGTVHLGVDIDGLSRYATDLATKTVPNEPFLLFGQMSTADRTRSPSGTESAWAYTHLPQGIEITADLVDAHVARVEAQLEHHAPGFKDLIVGRYVQSPARLEAENPSLVGGTVSSGTGQLHQQLVFRPVPGLGGASTPIDRLLLAGASAHPGGGVHGGPGANAARAALARAGLTGRPRRAVAATLMKRIYTD